MAKKIVVLDDGETWGGAAQILTITDEAWEKLCRGESEVCDLTEDEVTDSVDVNTGS